MLRLKGLYRLCMGLCLCALLLTPAAASAQDHAQIPVYIAQEKQQWEQQPFILEGNTMVPMRALFEKLGFAVTWDAGKQTASASKGGLTIVLTINKATAIMNKTTYLLEVSPVIRGGSTFMPLRFVSEAAGADVAWDETERSVHISFDSLPQQKIRKLVESVTLSSSFVQTVVALTAGDGIKKNDVIIQDIVMSDDNRFATIKFEAGFTVSKALKSSSGITLLPTESVVYEFTCDVFKDSYDQWILQTQPDAMPYKLKEKKPFMR